VARGTGITRRARREHVPAVCYAPTRLSKRAHTPDRGGGDEAYREQGTLAMAETMPPVSVTQQKDVRVVEFTNNRILDEANIADIGSTLKTMIEERSNPKLLLDFSNVDHLSSAALGMLINTNNAIKQGNGQLRLSNIKPNIYEVFVITKLNKLFRIYPTRDEAMASFNQ
jgi:anti-sigma B factor antagonist